MCESNACDSAKLRCIPSKDEPQPVFDYRALNKQLIEIATRRYAGKQRKADTYLTRLYREIEQVAARFDRDRRLVQLHESGERVIAPSSRAYANRLSSLFYALTRLANDAASISEQPPHYRDA